MTEHIVNCKNCCNIYINISNGGHYCGAYVEGKTGTHIIRSYEKDGKYYDVFDCDEYTEQCQMKIDTRQF